jgi:hypothetical protein
MKKCTNRGSITPSISWQQTERYARREYLSIEQPSILEMVAVKKKSIAQRWHRISKENVKIGSMII